MGETASDKLAAADLLKQKAFGNTKSGLWSCFFLPFVKGKNAFAAPIPGR
jgi:hypothetical protein